MRADWEDLPVAGILEREELEQRRYRGLNPDFVKEVWAKRRQEAGVQKVYKGSIWAPERKAMVFADIEAGLSQTQIAKKLGISRTAIARMLARHRAAHGPSISAGR